MELRQSFFRRYPKLLEYLRVFVYIQFGNPIIQDLLNKSKQMQGICICSIIHVHGFQLIPVWVSSSFY